MLNQEQYGIVILGHGSRAEDANKVLGKLARQVEVSAPGKVVVASMQFGRPNLFEAVSSLVDDGLKKILIAPLFFYNGAHMLSDIPEMVEELRKAHPATAIELTENIGADHRIGSILLDRIWDRVELEADVSCQVASGQRIESKSFEIIDNLISKNGFSNAEREIAKRIVHATGDPEIYESICFSKGAVESGKKALGSGRDIIVDVNMVATGINKKMLRKFGSTLKCELSDSSVIAEARVKGKTRAQTAILRGLENSESPIVVIGNAPTALFEVLDFAKINEGSSAKPSLIIGIPVGFVDAAESKEALKDSGIPYITITGTRGGSASAVAAMNALMSL